VRRLTDEVHDAREVRGAEDPVHFGHLPEDLAAVALREAAGDDEASAAPSLLQSRQLQDRRDRKSTRLNSSHQISSYAVLCWKKNRWGGGWDRRENRSIPAGATCCVW